MKEQIERMQLEARSASDRHKSQIEALVRRIKRQELTLKADKEETAKLKERMQDLKSENEMLKSSTLNKMQSEAKMAELGLRKREEESRKRILSLEDENALLRQQLHETKDMMTLAKHDVESMKAMVSTAQKTAAKREQDQQKLENAAARVAKLEFENRELQSRVSVGESNEKLLKIYRKDLQEMDKIRTMNRKIQHEVRVLREREIRRIKLEKQVEYFTAREAEFMAAIHEKERFAQEVTYLKHQIDAWKKSVVRFFPEVGSPAEATKSIASMNKRVLTLLEEQSTLLSKEKKASSIVSRLETEISRKSSEMDVLQINYATSTKRLKESTLKLGEMKRQRDSLKEMLDHYDKWDTKESHDDQRKKRLDEQKVIIDRLEKEILKLTKEKKRSQELESELHALRSQQKHTNKLLEKTERENDVLHQKLGRGDYDKTTTKVVHFKFNPLKKAAQKKKQQEVEKLLEQIKDLETKLSVYAEALASVRGEATNGLSFNDNGRARGLDFAKSELQDIKAMAQRRAEEQREIKKREREAIEEADRWRQEAEKRKQDAMEIKKRLVRLKEVFHAKVSEFREACYGMTGYKIDVIDGDKYRLKPMYAERDTDFLLIHFQNGKLSVLATDFVQNLDKQVRSLLTDFHSVPAFLSQITLDLFNQTTIAPR